MLPTGIPIMALTAFATLNSRNVIMKISPHKPNRAYIVDKIVKMDNCSIHHIEKVKELLDDAGIMLIFLPPYSPDLNLIDKPFCQISRRFDTLYLC